MKLTLTTYYEASKAAKSAMRKLRPLSPGAQMQRHLGSAHRMKGKKSCHLVHRKTLGRIQSASTMSTSDSVGKGRQLALLRTKTEAHSHPSSSAQDGRSQAGREASLQTGKQRTESFIEKCPKKTNQQME